MVDRATSFEEEDLNNGPEVCDPSDNDEGSVIEEEIVEPPAHSSQNQGLADVDPTPDPAPETQEDVPKKSYASIVSLGPSPSFVFYFLGASIFTFDVNPIFGFNLMKLHLGEGNEK